METSNKTVRIFMLPQQFPCGPQSSCCGPIGQTEEEVRNLKTTIEKELDTRVEVLNVMMGKDMRNHLQILRLVRSFGSMAFPIIALGDDIVSMGNPTLEQAVSVIREKMNQI